MREQNDNWKAFRKFKDYIIKMSSGNVEIELITVIGDANILYNNEYISLGFKLQVSVVTNNRTEERSCNTSIKYYLTRLLVVHAC